MLLPPFVAMRMNGSVGFDKSTNRIELMRNQHKLLPISC